MTVKYYARPRSVGLSDERRTYWKRRLSGTSGCLSGLVDRRCSGRSSGRTGHHGGHCVCGRRRRDGRWRGGHGRGGLVGVRGCTVVLSRLVQSGLYDGWHAWVGVPECRTTAQHVETRVPDGRVGWGAARQNGPHAPGRFLALFRAARNDGHFFDVVVRIRSL